MHQLEPYAQPDLEYFEDEFYEFCVGARYQKCFCHNYFRTGEGYHVPDKGTFCSEECYKQMKRKEN